MFTASAAVFGNVSLAGRLISDVVVRNLRDMVQLHYGRAIGSCRGMTNVRYTVKISA